MSRMDVDTLTLSLNGRSFKATRKSYTTGGFDPTRVVIWESINDITFQITEFQGTYTGVINGVPGDTDAQELVCIHRGLEEAFDLMEHWLAGPQEVDPMGGPERYE